MNFETKTLLPMTRGDYFAFCVCNFNKIGHFVEIL